jgi:hypothetical protein
LSFMSGLIPFSLVLNSFHWFNFVENWFFQKSQYLFFTSGRYFIYIESFFELFDSAFDNFGPLCPLSTALASVKRLSFLSPSVPGSELKPVHASSVQSELTFFLRHRRHCDYTL